MKWIRNTLKGMSLTAALFAFQACYGTMHADYYEAESLFRVVSADDGRPLPGIGVEVQSLDAGGEPVGDWQPLGLTDSAGEMACIVHDYGVPNRFRFADSASLYTAVDTVVSAPTDGAIEITLGRRG